MEYGDRNFELIDSHREASASVLSKALMFVEIKTEISERLRTAE